MIKNPDKEVERLLEENKQLREMVKKERSKEICHHCHGSGEIWTYWDGDTFCHHCHGSGRV